jgi:hypothetical protein
MRASGTLENKASKRSEALSAAAWLYCRTLFRASSSAW